MLGRHIVSREETQHLNRKFTDFVCVCVCVYNNLFNLMHLPLLKQLQPKVRLLLCCRKTLTETKLNTPRKRKSRSKPPCLKTTMQGKKNTEREKNISGGYSFVASLHCVCAMNNL